MKNAFLPGGALVPRCAELYKWGVVACDQYTSEPEYWARVRQFVGDAPSTLHMILPEVYLTTDCADQFSDGIKTAMQTALDSGILHAVGDGYILVERTLRDGDVRHGLIGRLDLEAYEYKQGSTPPVRATEGTVIERIPPRCAARRVAPIELPHVMLLVDDSRFTVIEPSLDVLDRCEKLYDTDLMEDSGHLCGFLLNAEETHRIEQRLDDLFARPMAIAVGDGNHSLAAAKSCWDEIKSSLTAAEIETHPARFALCELVNLHSPSLHFEPIHRVVTGIGAAAFAELFTPSQGGTTIEVVTADGSACVNTDCASAAHTVAYVQNIIDAYIAEHGGEVDYVHGDDVARELGAKPGAAAVLLPSMPKSELFASVLDNGSLPRKTFSMGHAYDKRFYFEARAIR